MSRPRLVVRVSTSYYLNNNSKTANYHRRLTVLKRKSDLDIDDLIVDPDIDIGSIINLHEVPDGIYELETINAYKDWETGAIEDWDLKLVEYDEEKIKKEEEGHKSKMKKLNDVLGIP